MSLLAILISLILKKLLPAMGNLRSLAWVERYQNGIRTGLASHEKWRGIPSLLLIVLIPVIGVAIIQYLLNDLLVFFSFVFSIIVLTYCLGPKDRHQLVHQYLDAEESGDTENAETTLQEIFSGTSFSAPPEDKPSRERKLIECVLIQTHEQVLAILFWFVILGPMGALLYRLTVELLQAEPLTDAAEPNDTEFRAAVTRLHYLLAWLPSHLTALSYAVMGSFVHALHAWQDSTPEPTSHVPQSSQLLVRIGMASLQLNNHPLQDETQQRNAIRETLGLCARSLVAWITILALMTLTGWAA
jgi:membrane protein required for beta-lactamase induction